VGKASVLDKAVGKMDKVKVLNFWLFRRSDTVVCRSSAKSLIMPTGMKPVSSVRLVGRRQSSVRPVRRTTRDCELLVMKIPDYGCVSNCYPVVIINVIVMRTQAVVRVIGTRV